MDRFGSNLIYQLIFRNLMGLNSTFEWPIGSGDFWVRLEQTLGRTRKTWVGLSETCKKSSLGWYSEIDPSMPKSESDPSKSERMDEEKKRCWRGTKSICYMARSDGVFIGLFCMEGDVNMFPMHRIRGFKSAFLVYDHKSALFGVYVYKQALPNISRCKLAFLSICEYKSALLA